MEDFPRRAIKIKMNKKGPTLHICEVLRKINDNAQSDTENHLKIRQLAAIATSMARRMSLKLYEYNKEWDKDWWDKNPDYEKEFLKRTAPDYKVETIDLNNYKN